MKLIYKPFGIVLGILGRSAVEEALRVGLGHVRQGGAAQADDAGGRWPRSLAAAAVQGVTFKVTRAAVDRAGAKGWDHLFGVWPGPKRQEKSQAAEAVR